MDKVFSTKNRAFYIALAILLLYFLPFIILGENSVFTIGDSLDGAYTWQAFLAHTKQTYNFNPNVIIPNAMCGLTRGIFPNGLFITTTLFYFFKSSTAYIINFILTHLIGFAGMFLLIRKHILKEEKQYAISLALALIFAIVPFFSIYGACVPYQPLLLYAFLNLLQDKAGQWKNFLIIALTPFYCDAVLTEPFILIFLTGILVFQCVTNKKIFWRFVFGIGLLFFCTILFQVTLIYQNIFNPGFHSIRDEFDLMALRGDSYKWWAIVNFVLMLYQTEFHTGIFDAFPVIVGCLVAISILLYKKRYNHVVFYLVAFIILTSFFYVFYDIIVLHLGNKIPLIRTFQFNRFYFLLPAVWVVLFAYCIKEIYPIIQLRRFTWVLVIVQFIITLCFNTEYKSNIKVLLHKEPPEPSVKSYLAEKQFSQIKNYIGLPQKDYRVVSVGMHPNIAIYNGFYTLDGYTSVYDIRYKHKFRKIIAGELNKSPYLKRFFDKWGGRCYIFSAELSTAYLCGKNSHRQIEHLSLDFNLMKEMGCKYILSAVPINNLDTATVHFEKEFENKDSFWNIYLYSLR